MAVILDGRVIRKFFREVIGKSMGLISVWTEGISGLAGAERHQQARWEDRVFSLLFIRHVLASTHNGTYRGMGKG